MEYILKIVSLPLPGGTGTQMAPDDYVGFVS